MHASNPLRIDLRQAAAAHEPLQIACDKAYFEQLGDAEIVSASVTVELSVSGPRAGVYRLAYHILGTASTPCDRCGELVELPLDIEDERTVTSYDSDAEPTDEAPLAERGDAYHIGHDLFELIALARPLSFSHKEGQCDPTTEAYIAGQTE